MEGINSSLQVHEGTQSFAGRGEQLVSVSSEDSMRQQGLKCSRMGFRQDVRKIRERARRRTSKFRMC